MSGHRLPQPHVIDTWHRRPVYRARIVNSEIAAIVIKSARNLKLGTRISFACLSDLEQGAPKDWRSAVIWRIDKGCLHLTRT